MGAIAAGDIGVTVTWTNIDSKGKAENADPSVTATTVTLAATELPSLEPAVVEETDDGTGETDEEGDSAAFIKATLSLSEHSLLCSPDERLASVCNLKPFIALEN